MSHNQPPSRYNLDSLCSVTLTSKHLEIILHPGLFDEKRVSNIVNRLDEVTKGGKYLTLINCEPGSETTFKSLKVLSTANALKYATAKAYVIHTVHQRVMATIFLLFFKQKIPIRFFKKVEDAKNWLNDLVIY